MQDRLVKEAGGSGISSSELAENVGRGVGGTCCRVSAWWTDLRRGRALQCWSVPKCSRTRDGRDASWLCPKAPGDQSLRELSASRPPGPAGELPALHPHAPP